MTEVFEILLPLLGEDTRRPRLTSGNPASAPDPQLP